jgi:hypothetical protein
MSNSLPQYFLTRRLKQGDYLLIYLHGGGFCWYKGRSCWNLVIRKQGSIWVTADLGSGQYRYLRKQGIGNYYTAERFTISKDQGWNVSGPSPSCCHLEAHFPSGSRMGLFSPSLKRTGHYWGVRAATCLNSNFNIDVYRIKNTTNTQSCYT